MPDKHASAMRRTTFTMVLALGWLAALLVWWAFYAEDFTVSQKFAVSIISLLVAVGIVGTVWIPFALRYGDEDEREMWEDRAFRWRVTASVLVVMGVCALMVYWLWFPGKDYNWCRSLVVILVLLIVGVIIMTPMWMGWGRGRDMKDVAETISDALEDAVEDAFEGRDDDDDD